MRHSHFLHFYSVKFLAKHLGYPETFLNKIANDNRKFCSINPKRNIGGKERIIAYPNPVFKNVLKSIDKKILTRFDFPDTFHGGVKGASTIDHAKEHVNKRVLLKIDLKNFYPSVTPERVQSSLIRRGFSKKVADLVTRIVTVEYPHPHLPQGFPTSPKIALLTLENFEKRLHQLRKKFGWKVGFWVDDLVISANFPLEKFKNTIVSMFHDEGFEVNLRKTTVSSGRGRKMVTGLVVDRKVNVPKEYINSVSLTIHSINKFGLKKYYTHRGKVDGYKSQNTVKTTLLGKINYVIRVNPFVGKRLLDGYEKIPWK